MIGKPETKIYRVIYCLIFLGSWK